MLVGFRETEIATTPGSDSVEIQVSVLNGTLMQAVTLECTTQDGTAQGKLFSHQIYHRCAFSQYLANSDYIPVHTFLTLTSENLTFELTITILDSATEDQEFFVTLELRGRPRNTTVNIHNRLLIVTITSRFYNIVSNPVQMSPGPYSLNTVHPTPDEKSYNHSAKCC